MPNVYVLFCDDIRIEITGKLMVWGMYTGDILIPSDGFVVPRLQLLFGVDGPLDSKPTALEIEVTLPGSEPRLERPAIATLPPAPEGRTRWAMRHAVLFLGQPLSPGKIKAVVRIDGNEYVPSTPWIVLPPQPAPNPGPTA
jgi:hypothetical protein